MSKKRYNRRQILQYMATLGVLSALPAAVLAQIITRPPPRSPFGSSSTAEEVTEAPTTGTETGGATRGHPGDSESSESSVLNLSVSD